MYVLKNPGHLTYRVSHAHGCRAPYSSVLVISCKLAAGPRDWIRHRSDPIDRNGGGATLFHQEAHNVSLVMLEAVGAQCLDPPIPWSL